MPNWCFNDRTVAGPAQAAYLSASTGGDFFARVSGWPFWAHLPGLIDCGPARATDTLDVLTTAVRLRAPVSTGPLLHPVAALRAARDVTTPRS